MNRTVLPMLAIIVLALAGCARRDSTEEAAPADTTTSTPAAEGGAAPAEQAPDQTAPAEPGTTPADVATEPQAGAGPAACDAEAAQRFVGEIYTPELGEQARVASGARVARALRPGEVVTMEFSADRLSLTLDESGRIVRAACG